jgi:DNA-binding NarL/FixJ family response regulator
MPTRSLCPHTTSKMAPGPAVRSPEIHRGSPTPMKQLDGSVQHAGLSLRLRSRGSCLGIESHPRSDNLPSILCVHDDEEMAMLVSESLIGLGYAVELASGGELGLEKILANRPDLILCDLWMPRMNGLELLQKLSEASPHYSMLPFILLTGSHDRESELAGRRLGADDCLRKPIDFEMLGAIVENRLGLINGRAASPPHMHLTGREKEVLTWVGRGKTSADIAIILDLSERTVNFHCDNAIRRLDVVNRTQAVVKAMAYGVIGT